MLSRSSIDEANRHLYAMHEQILSLQGMVQQQNQELLDRDQQITQLELSKSQEIKTLKNQVLLLKEEMELKEATIRDLNESVSQLQSVLQFLPCVKGLLKEMEHSAVRAPQGKLLTNHTDNHTDEVIMNNGGGESPRSTKTSSEKELYF